MTKENMEKLTKVILERVGIQREGDKQNGEESTEEEVISWAIEEAWQNNELDYLDPEGNLHE